MSSEYSFIDLFAGIGGFRIALEDYGGRCVFSSEIDKHARKTYVENFDDIPSGDIKKIENNEIPDHDVLCGGFPCQSFSISGKKRGFEDARGTLFYEIARIADYHKPKILFLENVDHLVNHNGGKTMERIKEILDNIGYDIFYKIMNASYYGVPQSRKRVFIVCFRKDLKVQDFSFPKRTMGKVKLKDILQSDDLTKKYVKDVKLKWVDNKNKQLNIFDGYKYEPVRVATINKGRQGERIYSPNAHAITLSAKGGGRFSRTGGYYINGKARKLSPRECARLMGFPDEFKIPVSDAQAQKQFGNSVVVPLVRKIFKKILETNVLSIDDVEEKSEIA